MWYTKKSTFFLSYSFFHFMAVSNHCPLWEAAERVLPRDTCACSHQLQAQAPDMRTLTRLRIIGHGRKHSRSVLRLLIRILLFKLLSFQLLMSKLLASVLLLLLLPLLYLFLLLMLKLLMLLLLLL